MSYIKRYIVLAVLAGIACVLKFHTFGSEFDSVDKFRGAQLLAEDWNPLIADTVNEKQISVAIDNKEYTSQDTPIFMDENLNLMFPVDVLTEAFRCSSHLYDKNGLLLEKRNNTVMLGLENPQISVNNELQKVASPMMEKDGQYFISIGEIAQTIGYQYEWNMEENQAAAVDTSGQASIFPESYDLRKKGRVSVIKNQEDTGTCWAFAALSALESSILPEEFCQFSPDHMTLGNSFIVDRAEGGEYTMSLAYLLSWQGPVYEEEDPFDGQMTPGLAARKHIQEVQMMEGKDYEKIKEAVFQYGGVQTSFYSALSSKTAQSEFYNREKDAYCYIGTERPNHEVVIIGWDDNYPRENFSVNVEGDGAFICQNSWGEEFGEDGVFYVSYYDTNIGSHNVVYTKIEDTDNYDRIYQADLCGWVGQIGFNNPLIYGANIYTAQDQEELSAVGFYATGKNTEYSVYLVRDFEDVNALDNGILLAEGSLKNAGFYTIPVSQKEPLQSKERYGIVVKLETPGAVHPMAIEYAADESTKEVDLSDGEGYIRADGGDWERVEDTFSCNLCIKAYTKMAAAEN